MSFDKKVVRSYSSNDRDDQMLVAIAGYHDRSKSATIVGLVAKEFWRVYPSGTPKVPVTTPK